MRAVVCHAFGTPQELTIEDRALPSPEAGEVTVELKAWGVNYVDALMVAGGYQLRPELPFVPGLEAAGVVTARGADATQFEVGDRALLFTLDDALPALEKMFRGK